MRAQSVGAGIVAAMLMVATGCMHPAQDRVEADEAVGKAEAGGCRFEVGGGLAAVRHASAGRLTLWASAPTIRLVAECANGATTQWRVELRNAMPGIAAASGERVQAAAAHDGSVLPTESAWDVTLAAGERSWVEFAVPDALDTKPWRFAFLSDLQSSDYDEQELFRRINEDTSIRFVVGGGDVTSHGRREEFAQLEQDLRGLAVPHYTTLGNHELGESPTLFHEWFGRGSFSFAFHDTRFTLVDSASATLDPAVYGWLEGWLREGQGRVHVFATHIPPIDPRGERNGSFANRNEAAKLLRMLAEGGVDLTLYGHVHSSYSFENAGISAWISGGGGGVPERMDGVGRHFLAIDVEPGVGVTAVSVVEVD